MPQLPPSSGGASPRSSATSLTYGSSSICRRERRRLHSLSGTLARTGHRSHGAFGRSGQEHVSAINSPMQARRMSPGKALRTEEEMLKSNRTLKSLVIAAGIGALFAIAPAKAEDASA